jgi:hypothetical protein
LVESGVRNAEVVAISWTTVLEALPADVDDCVMVALGRCFAGKRIC